MDGRVLALISAFLFGIGPIILTRGLKKGSADLAVLTSMLIGLPLLLLLAPLFGGVHFDGMTRLTLLMFALGGLLGPLFGRIFLYHGIDRLGSSRAFTIQHAAPLITALVAIVVLAEQVTPYRWLAILAIFAGLAIVGKRSSTVVKTPWRLSGLIFAGLAAVSFGVRPVVFKWAFVERPDPMTASVVGAAAALLGVVFYFAVTGRRRLLRTVERGAMGPFLAVGVAHNLGFLTINHAFNAGDVTLVYPINSIAPLLTFALSYFVLHNVEHLAVWDLVGTLSVTTGVVLLLV